MRLTNKASFTVRKHGVTTAGVPEHLGGFLVKATIAFVDSGPDTITDSESEFIKKGFKAGDLITVTGASDSANNDTFKIAAIEAGEITLESGVELTAAIAGDTITITAAVRAPQDVDDGVKVVVRAHPDNAGNVYVGNSSVNALSSSNNNMPLWRNSVCSMQVKDLKAIWVDAAVSGESVVLQFEA